MKKTILTKIAVAGAMALTGLGLAQNTNTVKATPLTGFANYVTHDVYLKATRNWYTVHNFKKHGNHAVVHIWKKKNRKLMNVWHNVNFFGTRDINYATGEEPIHTAGKDWVRGTTTINGRKYYLGDSMNYIPKADFENPKMYWNSKHIKLQYYMPMSNQRKGQVPWVADKKCNYALIKVGSGTPDGVVLPTHHKPIHLWGDTLIPVQVWDTGMNATTTYLITMDQFKQLTSGNGHKMKYAGAYVYQKHNHLYSTAKISDCSGHPYDSNKDHPKSDYGIRELRSFIQEIKDDGGVSGI